MKYELLHLKQFFPNLGTQSGDPLVKVYLPDNLTEMGRVCPVVLCCTASLSGTTVRGGRPDRTDQSKRGYMAL